MSPSALALASCLFSCLVNQCLGGKVVIEAMRHDVQQITATNFDGVISKFRDSQVAVLWFFKPGNKDDQAFFEEYNKVAGDLKSMVKVTAIDCDEWSVFCGKNKVTTTPSLMFYPINPQPAFKYEGKLELKAISGKLSRLIPDFSNVLTNEAFDGFLTTEPTKPKVLLFSNKPKPPTIFKALSSETVFKRTVKFGFVTEDQKEIIAKMKITKFPTIMTVSGAKADKKDTYKGDMNFIAIKDWVNLNSESGMGDKAYSAGGAAAEESIEEAKPWLVQEVPELTQKSQKDICFKGEGLCVIYLSGAPITAQETDMLSGLSKKFTSQLSDRGAKMKWMWMNLGVETGFAKLFDVPRMPSAVVFNPHKRLRFAKMDHGEDNELAGDSQGLANLMDKVLGGDARFKIVPGQKLPAWAVREEPTKKKTEL